MTTNIELVMTMSIASVFMGVPQSRYAALAILIAMVVVSLSILVGKEPIPLSQKFGFIVLVFLVSLPSLALSLFQLTCIVTGAGFKNQRPWCGWYAWAISALMIFYAVMLVVAAVMSMVAPSAALELSKKEGFTGEDKMQKFNNKTAEYFANYVEGGEAADEEEEKKEEFADQIEKKQAPVAAAPAQFEVEPEEPETFGEPVMGGASIPADFPFVGGEKKKMPMLPVPAASQPETFSAASKFAPF